MLPVHPWFSNTQDPYPLTCGLEVHIASPRGPMPDKDRGTYGTHGFGDLEYGTGHGLVAGHIAHGSTHMMKQADTTMPVCDTPDNQIKDSAMCTC